MAESRRAAFQAQPWIRCARVEDFDNLDERYLVHEYLHEKWTPFYFTDIAREMAEAKLSFAGSARFAHMSPVAWLADEQREMLETVTDPVEAEELRDYFANRGFRSDIFVRGKAPLSDVRLREQAADIHLWGNPMVAYKHGGDPGACHISQRSDDASQTAL